MTPTEFAQALARLAAIGRGEYPRDPHLDALLAHLDVTLHPWATRWRAWRAHHKPGALQH